MSIFYELVHIRWLFYNVHALNQVRFLVSLGEQKEKSRSGRTALLLKEKSIKMSLLHLQKAHGADDGT